MEQASLVQGLCCAVLFPCAQERAQLDSKHKLCTFTGAPATQAKGERWAWFGGGCRRAGDGRGHQLLRQLWAGRQRSRARGPLQHAVWPASRRVPQVCVPNPAILLLLAANLSVAEVSYTCYSSNSTHTVCHTCGAMVRSNISAVRGRLLKTGFLGCREGGRTAHDGAVVGVAAEASNKLLVSGGYDGRLCIWGFKSRKLASEINVGVPLTRLCHHRTSALLSVACDDLVIRMCAAAATRLAFVPTSLSPVKWGTMKCTPFHPHDHSHDWAYLLHHLGWFGAASMAPRFRLGQDCRGDQACTRRYDIEAVRSVRRFRGHKDRITDLAIAQDARWLLSASLDGTVRVWDVPSARCLQVPGLAHVLYTAGLSA